MLVLTRKVGEQVVMGNGQIVVRVLSHHCGKIRLGFEAPKNITIDRDEIYQRKLSDLKGGNNGL